MLAAVLVFAAAFLAATAFFLAAATFFAAVFDAFSSFATAAFALDKAGLVTALAADFFFAGFLFFALTLAILVSLLGYESCPLKYKNCNHCSPATYHINNLAYSKLSAKTVR